MYKFSHLKSPGTTLAIPEYPLTCFLGDHATLLMPINSQLYWFFGSYTMLVVQMIYCLIGALGLYKLIKLKFESENLALTGVFLFFTHYSLFAALDYDAHDNVYGMMFLPWILYAYYKNNFKQFLIFLGVFLLAREDLSFTSIMLGVCFLFDWKEKKKYALACLGISVAYFLFSFKFLIPHFSPYPNEGYAAWRFGHIGDSISEVIINTIKHPIDVGKVFIDDPAKADKFKYFFLSGGILFLLRPRFALLVVPTFFINCLSNSWPQWGNMYHYNILFSVLLPYVIISSAAIFRLSFFRFLLAGIFVVINLYLLDENFFRDWRKFRRIFLSEYYNQRTNLKEIEEGLKIIPPEAAVSAETFFTPHLAFRDKIYYLPYVKDAEYIAINEADSASRFVPYASSKDFSNAINLFRSDSTLQIVYEKNGMLVFKKKKTD